MSQEVIMSHEDRDIYIISIFLINLITIIHSKLAFTE